MTIEIQHKSQVRDFRDKRKIDLNQSLGDYTQNIQPLSENSKNCKLRRTLRGHFGKVYALQWGGACDESKDSPYLITASQDGKLIIWNGLNTHKKHAISLRSSWVMTCALEPKKGHLVACGGLDNMCSVHKIPKEINMAQTHPTELIRHDGYLSCCRFINGNNILTCSGDGTALLWDISQREHTCEFTGHESDVMSISVCPTDEENIFVSGSCDTTAKVWDKRVTGSSTSLNTAVISFGADTLDEDHAHESDINSVAFLPNGKSFATGSDDSTVRLFDMRACAQISKYHTADVISGVTSVAVSKSGRLIFAGYEDNTCFSWDTLCSGENVPLHQRRPYCLGGSDGHEMRVSCIDVNSNGQAVATGSWDTLVKVWA